LEWISAQEAEKKKLISAKDAKDAKKFWFEPVDALFR